MHSLKYQQALELSYLLWLWLYKSPDKYKEDSPYWNKIKNVLGNCPLCDYFHNEKMANTTCENCILYKKNLCRNIPLLKPNLIEKKNDYQDYYAFWAWKDFHDNIYDRKLCAAKIASVIRREYKKEVKKNKNIIRFKYKGRNLSGKYFYQIFTLEDIEQNKVSEWIKNNNIVPFIITKNQYTGVNDMYLRDIYNHDYIKINGIFLDGKLDRKDFNNNNFLQDPIYQVQFTNGRFFLADHVNDSACGLMDFISSIEIIGD